MIKRWPKSFPQSVQKKWQEGKKNKKTRKEIAALFALNSNAITIWILFKQIRVRQTKLAKK